MANTTSTSLKLTVQATGDNSGTWGQITNTNLLVLEQAIGGYEAIGITTGATLTFSNGVISNGKNQVLKLTGTIAANRTVTIPDSIEKTYIVDNATTGAYTVTFKTSSGTGVTWSATDKSTKIIYSDGTNVVDTAFVSNAITEVSEDTSPQLGGDLDTNSFNIKIDGPLANVWVGYEFWLDDKLSHCGVNSIHLLKKKSGWKIFNITDSRRINCNN